MTHVFMLVEGQTEEAFADEVIRQHLLPFGIYMTVVILTTSRKKSGHKFRGGIGNFDQFKRDLRPLLADKSAAAVTTMIDYYGLPRDFPGIADLPASPSPYPRVQHIEKALSTEFSNPRFRPYLSLHEFEALLFSSPEETASVFSTKGAQASLESMTSTFKSPEEINDGTNTHPAKRLTRLLPEYRKRLHGPMIARRIGLEVIRGQCSHFNEWITFLESLGDSDV